MINEIFFATVSGAFGERFDVDGLSKEVLFDHLEVFYNQRQRIATIGPIGPAAFERLAAGNRAA